MTETLKKLILNCNYKVLLRYLKFKESAFNINTGDVLELKMPSWCLRRRKVKSAVKLRKNYLIRLFSAQGELSRMFIFREKKSCQTRRWRVRYQRGLPRLIVA